MSRTQSALIKRIYYRIGEPKLLAKIYFLVSRGMDHLQWAKCVKKMGSSAELSLNGIAIYFNLLEKHDYMMYREIHKKGCYECETTALLERLLKPGMVFADVGANNGYYVLLAHSVLKNEGMIFAFEPASNARQRLIKNITANDIQTVQVFDCAVSNEIGHARLYHSNSESQYEEDGLYSLIGVPDHSCDAEEVKVATLDSLIGNTKIDIVKIDIEGCEVNALEGMINIIHNNPDIKIIIEWNETYSDKNKFEWLISHFDVYLISAGKNETGYSLLNIKSNSNLPDLCNLLLQVKS